MPIYSSQDIVNIADVQKIYLDALKKFPVMHLSPFEKIIDGDNGYVMSRQMNGNLSLKPNITKQGLLFRGILVHKTRTWMADHIEQLSI